MVAAGVVVGVSVGIAVVVFVVAYVLIATERIPKTVAALAGAGLASNIGGAATLIGDPPNIIIGSRAGLSFNDFLVHMAPIVVVELIVFTLVLPWLFRGSFSAAVDTEMSTPARALFMTFGLPSHHGWSRRVQAGDTVAWCSTA